MYASSPSLLLGSLLLWGSLSGCCQFATVHCWMPPEVNVAELKRLSVAPFSGDQGAAVAASLNDRLAQQRGWELVDPEELSGVKHAACTSCPSEAALLAQARAAGVDGIIVGEVSDYECSDELLTASGERLDAAAAGDEQHELHREARVAITFRLVDARTGLTRATKETRHEERCTSQGGGDALPSRPLLLEELTDRCIADFLELLAPHQEDCRMKLARNRWYGPSSADIRGGNRLALQGDWDAARDRWQAAVARNDRCDAALYNLAIDAAQRQQYAEAEELAMRAIRLRHTETYAQGLERIRQSRSGHDAAAAHQDQRVLQASADFR
jgi:hypothetical protein